MRNVSEQARVYKDELYVRGIGGVVTLNDLKDKQSLQDILGNGGGGDYPVEVKLPDLNAQQPINITEAEFNKWYFIMDFGQTIVKLPEIPNDGKVHNFCATVMNEGNSNNRSLIFVPAESDGMVMEQEDFEYTQGFWEFNFTCGIVDLADLGGPVMKVWFVTSTKFNDNPTQLPDGVLEYLASLEQSESGSAGGSGNQDKAR